MTISSGWIVLSAGMVVSLGACSSSPHINLSTPLGDGEAHVSIRKVVMAKPSSLGSVAVYGDLRLVSKTPIKSADLGCLYLQLGSERSSGVYVDSVADIMTDNYPANRRGTVEARVYWLFAGKEVADLHLGAIRLVVDRSREPCLNFGRSVVRMAD